MAQQYCTNCGKLISQQSNFCAHCGSAQHGLAAAQSKLEHRAQQYMQQADSAPSSQTESTNNPASEQPQREIAKRRLCPRAVWSFFLGYVSKTAVLALLFTIGVAFMPLIFGPLLVLYAFVLYVTAVIIYRNYYFEVNGSSFRKEYGILHKFDVTIPFNRIQNVNITRSLSDQILGLARIDIESAGSSAITKRNIAGGSKTKSEGHLPGVTLQQAREIHDILVERFAENAPRSNP